MAKKSAKPTTTKMVDREARDALLAVLPILRSQSWMVPTDEAVAKIEALAE